MEYIAFVMQVRMAAFTRADDPEVLSSQWDRPGEQFKDDAALKIALANLDVEVCLNILEIEIRQFRLHSLLLEVLLIFVKTLSEHGLHRGA